MLLLCWCDDVVQRLDSRFQKCHFFSVFVNNAMGLIVEAWKGCAVFSWKWKSKQKYEVSSISQTPYVKVVVRDQSPDQ